MRFKAVIFDLDGVICHTDQYHYQAWKQIADQENVFFDEQVNNRLRGVSRMESLEIILEQADRPYTEEEKSVLAETKNEIYKKLLKNMTRADLTEEVKGVLDNIKNSGIKVAIGSSSRNTKLILSRIGLADYFHTVSDGTYIQRSKPDPEVFLKAAEALMLAPEECLVVEDAQAGIIAAHRGGFHSAGIGEASKFHLTEYPLSCMGDLLNVYE